MLGACFLDGIRPHPCNDPNNINPVQLNCHTVSALQPLLAYPLFLPSVHMALFVYLVNIFGEIKTLVWVSGLYVSEMGLSFSY